MTMHFPTRTTIILECRCEAVHEERHGFVRYKLCIEHTFITNFDELNKEFQKLLDITKDYDKL